MRFLRVFALAVILVAVVTAVLAIPSCIEPFFTSSPELRQRREERRKIAREIVERYRQEQAGKPFEEWPQHRREIYKAAVGVLEEMGEKVP